MTLILGLINRFWVAQVTDRLVTRQDGARYLPFDPRSNKNLIYVAPDGVLTIAYTGHAYIEGLPTDHWLAQVLWDREIQTPQDGRHWALQVERPERPLTKVGQVLLRLRDRLQSMVGSQLGSDNPHLRPLVVTSGWQRYASGRARPFACAILPLGTRAEYTIQHSPRYVGHTDWCYGAPSANIGRAILQRLHAQAAGQQPDEAERILAEHLRAVSATNPTVSEDAISLILGRPRDGVARVRFLCAQRGTNAVTVPGSTGTVLVAYTPWVLGPGLVRPPGIIAGGAVTVETGGYTIRLEAPTSGEGPVAGYQAGQPRPPAP